MSELVKQLRRTAKTLRLWSAAVLRDDAENVTGDTLLYDAAADEIERLQNDLRNSEVSGDQVIHGLRETIRTQSAEIARLLTHLESLAGAIEDVTK